MLTLENENENENSKEVLLKPGDILERVTTGELYIWLHEGAEWKHRSILISAIRLDGMGALVKPNLDLSQFRLIEKGTKFILK